MPERSDEEVEAETVAHSSDFISHPTFSTLHASLVTNLPCFLAIHKIRRN